MDFARIEPWADDVIASSFENWPKELRVHALAEPLDAIPISAGDMRAVLSQNAQYRRFLNISQPVSLPSRGFGKKMEGDAFPKIGPVSWKEISAFISVPLAAIDELMPVMLRGVTDRMAFILHAFVCRQVSTKLHVFPFVDLSKAFEVRFHIEDGEPVHAKWMNRSDRYVPPPGSGEKLSNFAANIAERVGIGYALLDLLLIKGADGEAIKVVEVNPILERSASGRLFLS
ncbi:hypothetical protein HFO63_32455 [Rhizobium laguerreae]|uniref:Uncharacterized protein n=2 Tax=Rhizobium/Agrobacterium group TaxID=227290 RepID=A0AAJ3A1U2_9HYPH|nr:MULTISPECIES: hypothetical protein [Rhizobium]MBY3066092.1 hypothetical protein [Rhizobium laguerreae]MBY3072855.1 hypothetical protein [Rhizobium laguerreae]MBY3079114.1 hypothetical protein [Rhizobium laguerreae]MBY3095582.1 hypothetical protein [Rhizobium laguerreae]MBY3104914.1 hypothetical protein [Rhizobium laguerreae]